MILPFSTHLNGKPTYFIKKIWEGLLTADIIPIEYYLKYNAEYLEKFGKEWDKPGCLVDAKIHTIRQDPNRRWKTGYDIHFFINNRTPNMFRFAPVIKVLSTQRIFMSYFHELEISIDGRQLTHTEIDQLYKNDGFDDYDDFEAYFLSQMNDDKEFSGKIIHWTNFKYDDTANRK